jgi:hypothetical protein
MISLRVEDGYGSALEVVITHHEGAAALHVVHDDPRMVDFYLDAAGLRDLARMATIAAAELDRVARSGSSFKAVTQ